MQIESLKRNFDRMQLIYGDAALKPIYGAGCKKNPKVMFVFMNPTARNVSAHKNWKGLQAPWLGTKQVWELFYNAALLSKKTFQETQELKSHEWTPCFSNILYKEVSENGVYITNLAKCTLSDARPLSDSVFLKYIELMRKEILLTNPSTIITFGNQVSSILLNKKISISNYSENRKEVLSIDGREFNIFPTHYPVGQGRRNMPLALKRIKTILKNT